MAKKRPRTKLSRNSPRQRNTAKTQPEYWRKRLFRNSFTYRGKRREVAHWSVKIQHQGERKTFSLRDTDPNRAAKQACDLFNSIVSRGWDSVLSAYGHAGARREAAVRSGFDPAHWAERLVQRKYTEAFRSGTANEFSVRIEHEAISRFFPLGTGPRRIAATRAARIYRALVKDGWLMANKLFARELSVAFRWADSPLAWTYTTLHTQPIVSRSLPRPLDSRSGTLNVAIAESDDSLRHALAWCINQEDGCRCVRAFATGKTALDEMRCHPVHLLLVSENLADQSGAECLKQLGKAAPSVAGLPFSIYEDAEELFESCPGGASSYLFRRTPATRLLEPLAAAQEHRSFGRQEMANSIRQFFAAAIATLPFGGSAHELNSLTRREHEILGLLSKGHPDKEIATLLRISTWTVHGHLKKIFEKLKAHNRTDAVVKYLNK
jgi:DNA-binding NarL/FixJ family response regulator